ncbi:MAG: dockerin type I repeat-containing protein [Muribaculaceae bacterium]|nr:dockerin type I repeat-containing protein [Muribaculaceae bacterium]
MNKFLSCLFFAFAPALAFAIEPLASFSSDDFEGWEYTRDASDVALNQTNIIRHRITLFHDYDRGLDYTLLSPMLNVDGLEALEVQATLHNNNNGDSQYQPEKTSPTFELLDADLNVVATVTIPIETNKTSYNFTNTLLVPTDAKQLRLRVAVWGGDVHNVLAADQVTVFPADAPITPANGDVNGDGVLSGADVTTLYNVLLDGVEAAGNADVNGDGIVNGSDVTALYTLLLN